MFQNTIKTVNKKREGGIYNLNLCFWRVLLFSYQVWWPGKDIQRDTGRPTGSLSRLLSACTATVTKTVTGPEGKISVRGWHGWILQSFFLFNKNLKDVKSFVCFTVQLLHYTDAVYHLMLTVWCGLIPPAQNVMQCKDTFLHYIKNLACCSQCKDKISNSGLCSGSWSVVWHDTNPY